MVDPPFTIWGGRRLAVPHAQRRHAWKACDACVPNTAGALETQPAPPLGGYHQHGSIPYHCAEYRYLRTALICARRETRVIGIDKRAGLT